jgi:hypothetical protein
MSEFSKEIIKRVIAEICDIIGFHSIKSSSVDVFSDIIASCTIIFKTSNNKYRNFCPTKYE